MSEQTQSVAQLIVRCLEKEGVEYVFGIPGEENIKLVQALTESKKIRFILTRHEQGASFMADIYGRLTGRAGVCIATLGSGAINLLLGTADAQTDSSPLVALLRQAKKVVILAGHGVARTGAHQALTDFAQRFGIPVATTFMAKGVISDRYPESLGVIGFMRHDYENFAFDQADVILSVGYELQEFSPVRINSGRDKTILHINTFLPDVDAYYDPQLNIVADLSLMNSQEIETAVREQIPMNYHA